MKKNIRYQKSLESSSFSSETSDEDKLQAQQMIEDIDEKQRQKSRKSARDIQNIVCEQMKRPLEGFFSNAVEISPRNLEEKHREEAKKQAINNLLRIQTSIIQTPGVLSFRKAYRIGKSKGPPTMQSLFAGQASYLDYKKRTKPMQARELIRRLEDPLKRQKSQTDNE
jgi:hypothetical protein